MKFLEALDIVQENALTVSVNPKVVGMFRTKNPVESNLIWWDRETQQFRTVHTNKPTIISRGMLFADDWGVAYEENNNS